MFVKKMYTAQTMMYIGPSLQVCWALGPRVPGPGMMALPEHTGSRRTTYITIFVTRSSTNQF